VILQGLAPGLGRIDEVTVVLAIGVKFSPHQHAVAEKKGNLRGISTTSERVGNSNPSCQGEVLGAHCAPESSFRARIKKSWIGASDPHQDKGQAADA